MVKQTKDAEKGILLNRKALYEITGIDMYAKNKNSSCSPLFHLSCIQQILTDCLLFTKHCPRYREYNCECKGGKPFSLPFLILGGLIY